MILFIKELTKLAVVTAMLAPLRAELDLEAVSLSRRLHHIQFWPNSLSD